MRFGIIEINNFFRVKHIELDLSKSGVVGLFGENRDAGKSSIRSK